MMKCSGVTSEDPRIVIMRATAINNGDPTMRQVLEGIQISNTPGDSLINNKNK